MSKKTFLEHLEDLRRLILRSALIVLIASAIFYTQAKRILPLFLIKPIKELIFIYPAELLLVYFRVSFFLGLFVSAPVILYQTWRFLSEALRPGEKETFISFGAISYFLFLLGVLFGYFVVVPIALRFLLSFSSEYIRPLISVERYISFLTLFSFTFGIVFQLPLVIIFLTRVGIVNTVILSRNRRHIIVLNLIIAALLTPPDVFSQILLALPLILLYEISILLSWRFATR